MRANWINACKIDLHPRRLRRRTQRLNAVARAPMRPNNPLLLRLREHVHHSSKTLRPIGFGDAMHQADIEIIDSQFAPKAVKVSARTRGIAPPGLCQDCDFISRHVLKRLGYMRMASIRISGVEESQPVIVAVEQKIGESLHAERGLVRMMTGTNRARAHRQPARPNSRAAKRDGVGSRKLT